MKKFLLMFAIAMLLAGCAQTKVKDEWKDPGYSGGKVRSVIVLALPPDLEGKQAMDEFASQLAERGISAVPGYQTTAASAASKEEFMVKARELGYQMVLISRFLDKRSELGIYQRGSSSMLLMPDLYMWPSYEYVENEFMVFGTALYDAASGKAVWSAVSDTFVKGSDKKNLKSYVKTMLKKMERQGLVGSGK